MNSSSALLSILLALGIGAVGLFWGVHSRNTIKKTADADVERIQGEADADIEKLQGELDASEAELVRLQDENLNLRQELNLERDNAAELLRANDRLEARLLAAAAGGGLPAEGERDWRDEELDLRRRTEELTAAIRELEIQGPIHYQFTDWEGMRQNLELSPGVVEEKDAGRQSRAYAAMGFTPPNTDVRARMLDLLEGQLGAALYTGENLMLFHEEGTTSSVHDRTALAVELVRAMQDQHFDLMPRLGTWAHNDDARLALWATAVGDSGLVKIRFQLQDDAAAADDLLQSPTKMTREQFERIPAFVREYYLFPFALGDRFCQKLYEEGRWTHLNKSIVRAPESTAEVLHPELFMLSDYQPATFRWPIDSLAIDGAEPIWNNVAGELGIALMLNQSEFLQRMAELGQPDILDMPELVAKGYDHFAERAGSKAAKGWYGDRYLVYANPESEPGEDHVYWRSKWSSPEEADEFLAAVRKSLAFRRGAEFPEGEAADSFVTAGERTLLARKEGEDQVCVIDAGSPEFARILEAKFKDARTLEDEAAGEGAEPQPPVGEGA